MLERIIHVIFSSAHLDIGIMDRFGKSAGPKELFHVPRPATAKAVVEGKDGTIGKCKYDPESMTLRLCEQQRKDSYASEALGLGHCNSDR